MVSTPWHARTGLGSTESSCVCSRPAEHQVMKFYATYRDGMGISVELHEFPDVRLDDLTTFDRLFDVAVTVFALRADSCTEVVWTSKKQSGR